MMEYNESDFGKICDEVNKLLEIDFENLDGAALEGTSIWIKINRIYEMEAAKFLEMQGICQRYYLQRWKYYGNKASPKTYSKEPLDELINKTDIEKYLKADKNLIELENKLKAQERIIKFLEESLKLIRTRSYDINNAIAYRKFISGA